MFKGKIEKKDTGGFPLWSFLFSRHASPSLSCWRNRIGISTGTIPPSILYQELLFCTFYCPVTILCGDMRRGGGNWQGFRTDSNHCAVSRDNGIISSLSSTTKLVQSRLSTWIHLYIRTYGILPHPQGGDRLRTRLELLVVRFYRHCPVLPRLDALC